MINSNPLANGVAIFTRDGGGARQLQMDPRACVSFHSFGGWKASLFGDLHMYGPEGIKFYTRNKVITSRWPDPSTSAVNLAFPQNTGPTKRPGELRCFSQVTIQSGER